MKQMADKHDILVGVDIVSIERFQRLVQKYDLSFKKRIFTTYELDTYGHNIFRLASRFAVKEAVSKAFELGLAHMNGQGIPATDIEVRTKSSGAPMLQLYGLAEKFVTDNRIYSLKVSISHERHYAIAMVTGIQL